MTCLPSRDFRARTIAAFLLTTCAACLLSPIVGAASPQAAKKPGDVTLRLTAPAGARVGDVVPVEVWADGAAAVVAFEVNATIDDSAGRIEIAASDENANREDISVGDLTGYGVLAAYSPTGAAIGSSTARLGTFLVRVTAPGTVDLRIGSALLVDAAGNPLAVDAQRTVSLVVRDEAGNGGRRWPAPPLPWSLPPQSNAPTKWTDAPIELQLDWEATRVERHPCVGQRAAAAGGCIDIGDIQRLASTPAQLAASGPSGLLGATAGTAGTAGTAVAALADPTLVVNARGDASDTKQGDGLCRTTAGTCTLRAAIQEANAQTGPNTINFAIPGAAPFVIQTASRLPAIRDTTGGTFINGFTQPGATPNTDPLVSNATVLIEVKGGGTNAWDGFAITSGSNTLRGLSIYNFRRPIWIYRTGKFTAGNTIQGSVIGTDPAGNFVAPALVDLGHGIHIEQDSPNTLIGGPAPADRNVVSGNARHGIGVWHSWSDNTVVQGNLVGLSPDGTRRVPNRKHGVDLNFGASNSLVGGDGPGERNVISGNDDSGVEVSHTSETTDNRILNNFIGTRVDGVSVTSWSGNTNNGIWVEDGASANTFANNVIGGNGKGGMRLLNGPHNGPSTGNVIRDNWIGRAPNGADIPNGQAGIWVDGSGTLIIDNHIHNTEGPGIVSVAADAQGNTFSRNLIYDIGRIPIDLLPRGQVNPNDPGDVDTGPNTKLNFPVIQTATVAVITGTACAGCTVEVFATGAQGTTGAGFGPARTFLGSGVADGNGNFAVAITGATVGAWVSTTATDPAGNTSEMGANARIT